MKHKCQETSDNLKELSCLSKQTLFNHCEWFVLIFKMSSFSSNADMEMPVPLVRDIVNNAPFHSSPHTSVRHCIKSFTSFTCVSWTCWWIMPQILYSQLDWCQSCLSATNLEICRDEHDLLDYCTFGVEIVWIPKHSMQKRSQPEESIKTDTKVSHGV